jgi:hypothetical protein
MTNDSETPVTKKPKRSATSSGDRTRKGVLATSAGAIPLAISMLVSSTGGNAIKPHQSARHAIDLSAAELQFSPGCRMPFQSDPVPAIDGECSIQGTGRTDDKIAESKTKNDFCVPTSKVIPITYQTFIDLQSKTSFRRSADRSPLAKILSENGVTIGEGKYVEYVGYLLHAQYSNKSKGEAVNCNIPGEDTNDIHIQMVKDFGDDDACDSVTAEMSPHFRPESWTPDRLNSFQDRLIRLRGPLFYDGSHAPCHDNKRPNPQRISVWEIHPVYSVEICKQKSKTCQDWIPLDVWNGGEGGNEEDQ